jgi:hypothetical protein
MRHAAMDKTRGLRLNFTFIKTSQVANKKADWLKKTD